MLHIVTTFTMYTANTLIHAPQCDNAPESRVGLCTWVQPPVTFPIDDHVNVLHDYKKMGP